MLSLFAPLTTAQSNTAISPTIIYGTNIPDEPNLGCQRRMQVGACAASPPSPQLCVTLGHLLAI